MSETLLVDKKLKLAELKQELQLPKKPLYSKPSQCIEFAQKLSFRLNNLDLLGKTVERGVLANIIRTAREIVDCPADIMQDFLQPLLKCQMTPELQRIVCFQVAGNRKRLMDTGAFLYAGRTVELGWQSGIISEHLSSPTVYGGCYKVRITDGPATGFDFFMPVPNSFRRLSKALGVEHKIEDKDRVGIGHAAQAVKMAVLVYPLEGSPWALIPGAEHLTFKLHKNLDLIGAIRATATQRKRNLELLELRKEKCLRNLSNPCHLCKIGYYDCPRACKPHTDPPVDSDSVELLIKGKNIVCPTNIVED